MSTEHIYYPPQTHHVGVDLDGTLALFDEWRGIAHIGEPIPDVVHAVKYLLAAGHEVSIFTSRVAGDWPEHVEELPTCRSHIEEWCKKHIGRVLPITAVKHGWFTEIWDDKSLGIRTNGGAPTDMRLAWGEAQHAAAAPAHEDNLNDVEAQYRGLTR